MLNKIRIVQYYVFYPNSKGLFQSKLISFQCMYLKIKVKFYMNINKLQIAYQIIY